MSRRTRKKRGVRLPKTAKFFQQRDINNIVELEHPKIDVPEGRQLSLRLSWNINVSDKFDPDAFCSNLRHRFNRRVVHFLDANMFLAPTDDRIWKCLLSTPGRLAIAAPILDELSVWLGSTPSSNRQVHSHLQDELISRRGVIFLHPRHMEMTPAQCAHDYYTQLLGQRKKSYLAAALVLKAAGIETVDRQNASNACRNLYGERTQRLGRELPKEAGQEISFNDEAFVITALQWSLLTGREIAIITRDEGVLEQFYKAVWLIDTHYRSMLLARQHSIDTSKFSPRTFSVDDCDSKADRELFENAFEGSSITLLEVPGDDLHSHLPECYTPVYWHCIYLNRDLVVQLNFMAERGMQELLALTGCTGGLSSGVLRPRNVHAEIGPLRSVVGNYAAIAHDRSLAVSNYRISCLDYNLSLQCGEGFKDIVVV
jgi:hypothetical protein